MRKNAWKVLLWVVLALMPGAAYAQSSITGVARDTSGAVLPGVTVEAAQREVVLDVAHRDGLGHVELGREVGHRPFAVGEGVVEILADEGGPLARLGGFVVEGGAHRLLARASEEEEGDEDELDIDEDEETEEEEDWDE